MAIVQADIARWRQLLSQGQRGRVYIEIADKYATSGWAGGLSGYNQIMMQAKITTYSGSWGSAAIIGNFYAREQAGPAYNIALDDFSSDIISGFLTAIDKSIQRGQGGYLSDQDMRAVDYATWSSKGLGAYFPGNRIRYFDADNNFSNLSNWVVDDFFGGDRNRATGNLWNQIPLGLGNLVGAFGDDVGFTKAQFGFSASQQSGSAKNGRYVLNREEITVNYGGLVQKVYRDVIVDTQNSNEVMWVSDTLDNPAWGEIRYFTSSPSNALNVFRNFPTMAIAGYSGLADTLFGGDARSRGQVADMFMNRMGAAISGNDIRRVLPRQYQPEPTLCFAAGTLILMADGAERPIESVREGDLVMAFDGDGPLTPRRVVELHRNSTREFIVLNGRTRITPGHHVLSAKGGFEAVAQLCESGVDLVDAAGQAKSVSWTVEAAAEADAPWLTYNLTVDDLHTYVADGLRVHNTSASDLLPPQAKRLGGTFISADGVQLALGLMPDGTIVRITGADITGDSNTDAFVYEYLSSDGMRRTGTLRKGDYQGVKIQADAYDWRVVRPAQMGALLSTIGSSLGNYLGNGNPLASVGASSLLGTVGLNLGQAMDAARGGDASVGFLSRLRSVSGNFGQELATAFGNAAVGSVSSALALELGNVLGLKGFGAELFQTGASTVVGVMLNNALDMAHGVAGANLFTGFNSQNLFGNVLPSNNIDPAAWKVGALSSAIGAFIGSKLGSLIVQPTTQAGVVLSSLGSSLGAFMLGAGAASSGAIGTWAAGLASQLGSLGNFAVPGLGALVGFVLGAFIGNLFGKKKPRTPTASAETLLQVPYAHYELGAVSITNGGNRDLVVSMATSARDTLNSLIGMIGFGQQLLYVSNLNGYATDQRYGHTGGQLYVKVNGVQKNVTSADDAVDFGVLAAIRNTKIVGGNIFLKRVVANSIANNLQTLMGDMQSTSDYVDYLANRQVINGIIAGQPDTAFTAGYLATFARADELSVNKWTTSDFHGGLQGFLSSFDLAGHGAAFENANFQWNGGGDFKVQVSGLVKVSDPEGHAAQVYRLYDAALGRTADQNGLNGWTGLLNNGATLLSVAQGISNSTEFQNRGTASLSNADYVEWLYVHVVRRASDAAGKADWIAQLNAGKSRVEVLLGFSESAEHKAIVAAPISAGLLVDEAGLGAFSILPSASVDGRTVTINGLDKIAYTWVNAGAATSGNDYMEYRWNGAGVTLDDNHTETQTTYQYYWNGYDYDEVATQTQVTLDGGDDIFVGSQYNDVLYGRSGWDWLDGQAGNDTLYGGDQNDVLLGGAGGDSLFGEGGDDYLAAGDGADAAYGGAGADTLVDGLGSECLLGEDGDDTFLIAADATFNWFWGGTQDPNSDPNGKDTISAERMLVGVTFNLDYRPSDWTASHPDAVAANAASRQAFVTNAATGAWITSEGLVGIENATGSNFNDRLYGTVGANVLKGLAGDDTLYGQDGDDTLEGGAGADLLYGGPGADIASYEGSSAGVYVDLSTGEAFGGDADGDVLDGIGNLRGSKLADQLKGNEFTGRLEGLAGDDWLVATTGADVYVGGEGKDFVDYSVATAGVTLNLGGYTATSQTTGNGTGGLAASQAYITVEGVVGTAYADSLSASDGDQTFVGGAGNDTLTGGAGADTYVLNRGDGYDTVNEDATGWNVFSLGEGIKVSDLWIGASGGSSGWLDVGVRGTSDVIRMVSNFGAYPIAGNNKLKSIDLNGAGQLDVGAMSFGMAGDDNANTLYGGANRADLIFGYNGADIINGVQSGQTDQTGDVIVAGLGNDVINTSGGDDQFAYDRGDGVDTITDAGGEDTLVFGSTVAAEDVIYQVVGNDLYIGAKDATNTALTASQVADRVRIVNGGVLYRTYQDDVQQPDTWNTVEYVLAGGTSIDLRKLDIAWTVQEYWNYSNYYPIALDLDGDGLNLSTVDGSSVVVRTAQGGVSKIAWVGPTDGFLAVDRDGDGAINRLSEISFVQDKPGATSDLEGLRTWDSNGDGMLDKADRDFSRILLFVDANQNGRSTKKELRTLEQAGIQAINLGGVGTGYTAALTTESFVQNTLSFVWADGRVGEGYDVALARRVLGSEGLYAGDYQAEWGARDEDGTLGRLANDPKTAAKAARIQATKGLLDKLGASYAEVKAAAQLDFSDTDKVDAQVAKRWKKMDASQKAAWLSGQATGMDGQQNLAALRAISSGQALSNALKDSAQAGQDLIAQGLAQAGAQVLASVSDRSGTSGQAAANSLGVTFGAASGLGGGLAASQPLDASPSASVAIGQDQAWWRGETDGGLAGAGSLAALLAAMGRGAGDSAQGLSAADDPALLQQQMLLRQAMAGFGGQAGGSAAVWNRDATQASAALAAAGQAKTPSAFNLALAS